MLTEQALIGWLVTSYWMTHNWDEDEGVRGWIPQHVVERLIEKGWLQPDPDGEGRCAVVTDKGLAIYQLNAAEYGLDPMQFVEPPADALDEPDPT